MALDPSIPLAIQPPPQINPLQVAAQVQQFHLGREQALALAADREATAEDTKQKTIAAARANADEQAVRQYFASIKDPNQPLDPSSPDFTKLASQVGFTRASDISKGIDALRQQNLKTEGDARSMFGAAIGGIKALPPQMQADAYNTVVQHYAQRGLIDPKNVAPYSPQVLDQYQQQAMTPTQQTENARADAGQAATLPGQQADSAQKQRANAAALLSSATSPQDYTAKLATLDPKTAQLFPPPAAWTPKLAASLRTMGLTTEQATTAQQATTNEAETARAHRATEATAAGELGLKQKTFDATYGQGTDANGQPVKSPIAQAIAEYRMPPLTGRAAISGAGPAIMSQVTQINPSYDGTQFQTRQKTRNAFTTGGQAQQVDAMNTAVQHLDLLAQAAEAMKNGSFKPGNAVYNQIATAFGGTAPGSYEQIKHYVDGEVGNVVTKGAVTVDEMKAQRGSGEAASSPEQLQRYINNAIQIMGSKVNTLHARLGNALGKNDPLVNSMVMPEVQGILKARGFNSDGSKTGTAPAGGAPKVGDVVTVKGKRVKITAIHPDGSFDGDPQ